MADKLTETVERMCEAREVLQGWLNDTPRYDGNDARALKYQRNVRVLEAALAALSRPNVDETPIPMILHCPKCGAQHIDEPETLMSTGGFLPEEPGDVWDNPPHRSHLCHDCGCIWRPADVATEGVQFISTAGMADTWKPGDDCLALSDPNAVHVNMLRGTIARPSVEQIIHIYRPEVLLAALRGSADNGA